MAKAGKAPSTLRPPQAWRSGRSLLYKRGFEAGGTVSQLWHLFRRIHAWFVHPLPALSPLVSLSLSFHIHAHKIYRCLCSRTGSDPSLFLLFWSPVPRSCWKPGPSHSGITLSGACWMGPCCGEGRWHSPPVLSTISVLTISGNLNSPADPRLPIIVWSSPNFGTRLQGRWGGPGSIQVDCGLLNLPMRWASLENASHDLQCLMGREGPWKESEGTPKSWKARTPYFSLP